MGISTGDSYIHHDVETIYKVDQLQRLDMLIVFFMFDTPAWYRKKHLVIS